MSGVSEYQPDVLVSGGGTVYLLEPCTEKAAAWIDENTESEDWQWFGHSLAVEHGYLDDIVFAMREDDLDVQIAGQREREAAAALRAMIH